MDFSILSEVEQKDLLKKLYVARLTGAKRIRFRERDVIYRTDEEMTRIIGDLEESLGLRKRGSTVTIAEFGSGL